MGRSYLLSPQARSLRGMASRRRRAWGAVGLAALTLLPAAAEAQIVAPAGRTLFNRAVLVRTLLRFDDLSGRGGPDRRWTQQLAVVWGARPHLAVTVVAPFVVEQGGATTRGSGDAAVFVRRDLWRENVPGGFTRLAGEVGVRLPTGGAFGTGALNPSAAVIASHVRDPRWWVADLEFTLGTSGDGGLEGGDQWRLDLAYLHRLLPRGEMGVPTLFLVLEANAQRSGRARRQGAALPDTGGDLVFFSPGLELVLSRRVVLELAAPIPLVRDLDGAQPRPDGSLLLGARWLF